jgi:hypothetical protein
MTPRGVDLHSNGVFGLVDRTYGGGKFCSLKKRLPVLAILLSQTIHPNLLLGHTRVGLPRSKAARWCGRHFTLALITRYLCGMLVSNALQFDAPLPASEKMVRGFLTEAGLCRASNFLMSSRCVW